MRCLGKALILLIVTFMSLTEAGAQTQLTIYKGDLALVSDTRAMRIGAQQQELTWPAVAARLDPGSIHLAVAKGGDLTVLQERFFPLAASPLEMIKIHQGQQIEVRVSAADDEWLPGRLESIRGGNLVLAQGEAITLVPYGKDTLVRLPASGTGAASAPALVWQIDPQGGGQRTLALSYLTGGLTWTADYFGEVNASEDKLLLSAKATVHNRCGMAIENAAVTLAAGTVNQPVQRPQPKMLARGGMAAEMDMMAAPAPEPEAMADLQFYPLAQPLSLDDEEQVQRPLMAPQRIACKRAYHYRSHRNPKQITTALTLVNDPASGLGKPLPAGTWRLYRRTAKGLRFIGADQRPSAARNAELKLELGQAFDLSAERRVLQRRKLSARSEEQQVEITLNNGKKTGAVQIEVEEQMSRGQWEITKSSLAPTRKDADTLAFEVPVPADGKTRLTYTVVRRW